MDETVAKPKPWRWPGEWMRDEKFWRDVGSRTVSGLIVVFVGYYAAIGLGYVQQPGYGRLILAGLAVLILLIGMTYGARTVTNQDHRFTSNVVKMIGAAAVSLALIIVASRL